jgi:hypothetical protein
MWRRDATPGGQLAACRHVRLYRMMLWLILCLICPPKLVLKKRSVLSGSNSYLSNKSRILLDLAKTVVFGYLNLFEGDERKVRTEGPFLLS